MKKVYLDNVTQKQKFLSATSCAELSASYSSEWLEVLDEEGDTPLLAAAKRGDMESVEWLIAAGASVHKKTGRNDSLVHLYAVHPRFIEALLACIERGVEYDAPNNEGTTPLMIAVAAANKNAVFALLAKGASLQIGTVSLMERAEEYGKSRFLQTASPKLKDVYALIREEHNARTAFWQEIESGNLHGVARLFKREWLELRDDAGNTPLMKALIKSHDNLANWLYNCGASLTVAHSSPQFKSLPQMLAAWGKNDLLQIICTFYPSYINAPLSLLYDAIEGVQLEAVKLLLQHGADLNLCSKKWLSIEVFLDRIKKKPQNYNQQNQITAIESAIADEKRERHIFFDTIASGNIVAAALRYKSSWLEVTSDQGDTPLLHAAVHKQEKIFNWLLAKGANAKATRYDGSTVLHLIAQNNWATQIPTLLKLEVPVNTVNDAGYSALMIGCLARHDKVVEFLILIGGASLTYKRITASRCMEDGTGGRYASTKKLVDIVSCKYDLIWKAIKDKNYDEFVIATKKSSGIKKWLEICDERGHTPLLLAAAQGEKHTVEWLIEHGASVTAKRHDGATLLHFAAVQGWRDIANLALSAGISINAKTQFGRTPLAFAERCSPRMMQFLLERGASTQTDFYIPLDEYKAVSSPVAIDIASDTSLTTRQSYSALQKAYVVEVHHTAKDKLDRLAPHDDQLCSCYQDSVKPLLHTYTFLTPEKATIGLFAAIEKTNATGEENGNGSMGKRTSIERSILESDIAQFALFDTMSPFIKHIHSGDFSAIREGHNAIPELLGINVNFWQDSTNRLKFADHNINASDINDALSLHIPRLELYFAAGATLEHKETHILTHAVQHNQPVLFLYLCTRIFQPSFYKAQLELRTGLTATADEVQYVDIILRQKQIDPNFTPTATPERSAALQLATDLHHAISLALANAAEYGFLEMAEVAVQFFASPRYVYTSGKKTTTPFTTVKKYPNNCDVLEFMLTRMANVTAKELPQGKVDTAHGSSMMQPAYFPSRKGDRKYSSTEATQKLFTVLTREAETEMSAGLACPPGYRSLQDKYKGFSVKGIRNIWLNQIARFGAVAVTNAKAETSPAAVYDLFKLKGYHEKPLPIRPEEGCAELLYLCKDEKDWYIVLTKSVVHKKHLERQANPIELIRSDALSKYGSIVASGPGAKSIELSNSLLLLSLIEFEKSLTEGAALKNKEGVHAIELAAQLGKGEEFYYFLIQEWNQLGFNTVDMLNAPYIQSQTLPADLNSILSRALFWGIHHGNPVIVDIALHYGADLQAKKASPIPDITPLELAVHYNDKTVLDTILQRAPYVKHQLKAMQGGKMQSVGINRFYEEKAAFLTENTEPNAKRKRQVFEHIFLKLRRNGAIFEELEQHIHKATGARPLSWKHHYGETNYEGAAQTDAALSQRIRSGQKFDIYVPWDLLDKGQVSTDEYWQIFREVTQLALLKQAPRMSMDNSSGYTYITLAPILRDSLTGNILTEADYLMKAVNHTPGLFFFPPERARAIQAMDDPDIQAKLLNSDTFRETVQSLGGILLMDDPQFNDYYEQQFEKWHDIETDRINARYEGEHVKNCSFNIGVKHPVVYHNGNKLISDAYCWARHYVRATNGNNNHYPDSESFIKQFNSLMREHPLTSRVMWRMDLVYKLYSIALLFVENGRVPDFSLAPEYDGIGYVTPREVPNIVNKGKYFVGGCEFAEQVSSGNWLSGGSTSQSPGFGYQEALSSHNQTASSGNWLADMGGVVTTPIHKNSLDYVGETHVYAIRNIEQGYTVKIGESAQGYRDDGSSIRAEQQARRLERETNEIHATEVLREFDGKRAARVYETELIERFRSLHGESKNDRTLLPGNKGRH